MSASRADGPSSGLRVVTMSRRSIHPVARVAWRALSNAPGSRRMTMCSPRLRVHEVARFRIHVRQYEPGGRGMLSIERHSLRRVLAPVFAEVSTRRNTPNKPDTLI